MGGTITLPLKFPPSYGKKSYLFRLGGDMSGLITFLWRNEEAQDVAEYAVMLGVILTLVVGTIHIIGSRSDTIFSAIASKLQ
jgi:Flp pilus assembly pilin Flp